MMKVRLSITLSDDLVAEIDRIAGKAPRSAVMERLLRQSVRLNARAIAERDEGEKLDRFADWLDQNADDLLGYQSDPFA